MKMLPNLLTCFNIWLSFTVLLHIDNIPAELFLLWLIGAVVFDTLDGWLARKMDAITELGEHLDSISDVLSFGLLPALFLYLYILPLDNRAVLSSLPFLFTAIRLARFNLTGKKLAFSGLPSPANALLLVTSGILFRDAHPVFILMIITSSSLLMISTVPYPAQLRLNPRNSITPVLCILGIFQPILIVFLLTMAYSTVPPIYHILQGWFSRPLRADRPQPVYRNPEANKYPPVNQNG